MNERGQYGDPACGSGGDDRGTGMGGVLLLLGLTVGIYASSPGARHYYKHGFLPEPLDASQTGAWRASATRRRWRR